MKKIFVLLFFIILVLCGVFVFKTFVLAPTQINNPVVSNQEVSTTEKTEVLHPMAIESLRNREYIGSDFVVEQELADGPNYKQYVVWYKSEDLKIYGFLTVPNGQIPANGFPAIIFVHGYIPPAEYSTIENYKSYQAYLASSGFVTFKPDLRGHGKSEGQPVSAHFSEKYIVDVLYAIEYLKNYKDVDKARIGYWGHSNGGEIGLRVAVVSKDIKAYSFWAGVVGSYVDMFETYNSKIGFLRDINKNALILENGLPSTNSVFWNKIDPYSYLKDIDTPIEVQHGTNDTSVPVELSVRLVEELKKNNNLVEYFEYEGDNHNISNNLSLAFKRSIEFFNSNL